MNLSIATHQAGAYRVATEVYEGPLDLLLHLIEHAELDITKLALAQVTDQYLEHLRNLQELEVGEVSAFLVIAAKLIQIKSEVLLPRQPTRAPGEEDPGQALVLQLLAYRRYRNIANTLAAREAAGLRTHLRLAPPPRIESILDLSGIGLGDLVAAAQSVLSKADRMASLSEVVPESKVNIREKLAFITQMLRERSRVPFGSLLGGQRSRLEIVVTFLAVLELIKRHLIHAHQEQIFGEIELEVTNSWGEEDEFELEFGE